MWSYSSAAAVNREDDPLYIQSIEDPLVPRNAVGPTVARKIVAIDLFCQMLQGKGPPDAEEFRIRLDRLASSLDMLRIFYGQEVGFNYETLRAKIGKTAAGIIVSSAAKLEVLYKLPKRPAAHSRRFYFLKPDISSDGVGG